MPRIFTAFAWMLTLTSSPLLADEVCLVNESDHVALFTVVSGTERLQKQIPPQSHEFVPWVAAHDDQVIIVQTNVPTESKDGQPKMSVVDTKVLKAKEQASWNFCCVHGSVEQGLEMELLNFDCLRRSGEKCSDKSYSPNSQHLYGQGTSVELQKPVWFLNGASDEA